MKMNMVKPGETDLWQATCEPAEVRVFLSFGRKSLDAEQAADLAAGDVVELDCFVDDYVDLYVGGRPVARGRPVVIDGNLALRIQETLEPPLASRHAVD